MSGKKLNVLVLCTGNSARSIMTEILLNTLGEGRVQAYSAGSQPTGLVNPLAIEQLAAADMRVAGLHSKSWSQFATANAPRMDVVLTVCCNAASEPCPVWPGNPVVEHWNIADPAAAVGDLNNRRNAFRLCFTELRRRAAAFLANHVGRHNDTESARAVGAECHVEDGAFKRHPTPEIIYATRSPTRIRR